MADDSIGASGGHFTSAGVDHVIVGMSGSDPETALTMFDQTVLS